MPSKDAIEQHPRAKKGKSHRRMDVWRSVAIKWLVTFSHVTRVSGTSRVSVGLNTTGLVQMDGNGTTPPKVAKEPRTPAKIFDSENNQ